MAQDEIHTFLQNCNLLQFESKLREKGFKRLNDVKDFDDDQLNKLVDDIGMKLIHKKRFIKNVKSLSSMSSDSQPLAPSESIQAQNIYSDSNLWSIDNRTSVFPFDGSTNSTTKIRKHCCITILSYARRCKITAKHP